MIPHAGDAALLERCLESLGDDRVREVLVVVAEQATESLDVAQRHPEAQAVRVPTLLSFARATNLAAKRATGELLFLLNDDTAVEEGAIDRLAEALDAEPRLGAVGALLLNPDGTPQPSVYADPSWRTVGELFLSPLFRRPPLARLARFPYATPPGRETAAVWLSGAALMTRRRLFEEVGGLDEGYPHGVEDAAMCRAIRSRGRALALVEDARIVHDLGRSSYRSERSSQQVSKALVGGSAGWMRYWDEQGATDEQGDSQARTGSVRPEPRGRVLARGRGAWPVARTAALPA